MHLFLTPYIEIAETFKEEVVLGVIWFHVQRIPVDMVETFLLQHI